MLAKEFNHYVIDIAAVSEFSLSGEDKLRKSVVDYTLFGKFNSSTEKREREVGFGIRTEYTKHFVKPHDISEKIMFPIVPLCLAVVNVFFL